MPLGDELSTDNNLYNTDLAKNIGSFSMPYNINDICRVCLAPTISRKNSNLFFSSGRSIQLWAKVMACAWVQVFEGDGLPSQICYKCHNRLDIAYQFKQQCEAADAQIRQYLNRNTSNKTTSTNIELTQNQPEYLGECKPLNFNISNDCLDLVPTELSLNAYRIVSQETVQPQLIDFRVRDSDFASLKQEPGFSANAFSSVSKNYCQSNSSFKCETFNDDMMLENIPEKLFETVDETIQQATVETTDDSKLTVWDLQQKSQPTILNKDDFVFNSDDKENNKGNENNKIVEEEIEFLNDNRFVSPLDGRNMLPDVCSDSSAMEIDNECSYGNNTSKELTPITPEIPIDDNDNATANFDKSSQQIITKKTRKKIPIDKKQIKPTKDEEGTINVKKREKKEGREQCELCGKLFKYRNYMVHHLQTHTGVKPYNCSNCDQKFSTHPSLVTHLRKHSGERPYICAVCGKGFTQSAGLKLHMRAHTGEKPYECEICAKKFSQKSNLFIHKQIHSGQRNHICEICNKAFKFYKHLQSHMALHSEEKEFKCSVCQKGFHRKSYLHTHMSIHKGDRPFKCTVCDHGFSNSSNLRAHLRIHSGIKPYKCKVCKKAFAQSSALNRHMQQHSLGLPSNNSQQNN